LFVANRLVAAALVWGGITLEPDGYHVRPGDRIQEALDQAIDLLAGSSAKILNCLFVGNTFQDAAALRWRSPFAFNPKPTEFCSDASGT